MEAQEGRSPSANVRKMNLREEARQEPLKEGSNVKVRTGDCDPLESGELVIQTDTLWYLTAYNYYKMTVSSADEMGISTSTMREIGTVEILQRIAKTDPQMKESNKIKF